MSIIDPKTATQTLIKFLKESFTQSGFTKAVIGLSGGVDSATSCALLVRALGKEAIFPVLMPYGELYGQGKTDALLVCDSFEIPVENRIICDIQPMVDAYISSQNNIDNVRKGNVMARSRMIVLFDMAKKHKALVVGTENKSEHLLGYYTRFGDEASDIEPLRNLYKTQVYLLATYLGVPEPILVKAPTAGLWEGQTDESEFGFCYKDADEVLSALFDEGTTPEKLTKVGLPPHVVALIEKTVKENAFKHKLPLLSAPWP